MPISETSQISGETRGDAAHRLIRKRVIVGDLPGGSYLTVRAVAAELGMSFAPVTDAFRRLEQRGLLEAVHGKSWRVPPPDADIARDELALRLAIETEIARRVSQRRHSGDLERLSAPRTPGADETPRRRYLDDLAFHRGLAELAGSSSLERALDDCALRLLLRLPEPSHASADPCGGHDHLVRSIGSACPDRAAEAIRAHVEASFPIGAGELTTELAS